MDVNFCLNFCGANTYAGLEYSDECWCAPYLNVDSQQLPDANCSLPCAGDGTEICGGSLKLVASPIVESRRTLLQSPSLHGETGDTGHGYVDAC